MIKQPSKGLTTDQKIDKILVAVVNLAGDVSQIKDDGAHIRFTVDQHTTTLDGIAKQVLDLSTDKMALVQRLERYDKFMKIVADKLGLDLEALLN